MFLSFLFINSAFAEGGDSADMSNAKYLVKVKLKEAANQAGKLYIYKVVNGQAEANPFKICNAIGNPVTDLFGDDKKVRTPTDPASVKATTKNLLYKGNYISMKNAVYFEDSHGNPIALHSGELTSNSHGCVRNDCHKELRDLANEDSTPADDGQIPGYLNFPIDNDQSIRAVKKGHMIVDVDFE